MADQNAMQNIDKISYGAATALGLAVLAVPLLSGAGLRESTEELEQEVADLRQARAEAPAPEPALGTTLVQELVRQWEVEPGGPGPDWVVYREKVLVVKEKQEPPKPAVHEVGCIRRIEFHRDAEKEEPFLKVVGEFGAMKFVDVQSVELYRSVEGEEGELQKMEVPWEAVGFEHLDYAVEPGKSYSYSFATRVTTVDPQRHPLDHPVRRTGEVGTPPIPYDVNLYFNSITPGLQPTLTGSKSYWDYEKGKLVKDVGYQRYGEKEMLDGEGGKWIIHRILDARTTGGAADVVEIRNRKDRSQEYRLEKNTQRPVKGWPPVQGNCDKPAEAGAEEGVPESGVAEEGAATSPSPATSDSREPSEPEESRPPRRGGRRF